MHSNFFQGLSEKGAKKSRYISNNFNNEIQKKDNNEIDLENRKNQTTRNMATDPSPTWKS